MATTTTSGYRRAFRLVVLVVATWLGSPLDSWGQTPGSVDTGFDPGQGPNGLVTAMVVKSDDDRIVIVGEFTAVAGVSLNRVARLNTDGSVDTNFMPGAGADGPVDALALRSDGKVAIIGSFSTFDSQNRNQIARLNLAGQLDQGFDVGTGSGTALIRSLAFQPDGKLLVGGEFQTFRGENRRNVVRLDDNGAVDLSFNAAVDAYFIDNIVVESSGTILVSGWFRSGAAGFIPNRILRLNPDGSLARTIDVATPSLRRIVGQSDGKILFVGLNSNSDILSRWHLGRLNSDGSPDGTFTTFLVPGPHDPRTATQVDGKIVFSGSFTEIQGTPRTDIARVQPNGIIDAGFDAGVGVQGNSQYVAAMARQLDGKIVIAGDFGSVNGVTRNRIARLHAEPPPLRPDARIRNSYETSITGDNIYNVTGEDQSQAQLVVPGLSAIYEITVQNDSRAADGFMVTGPAGTAGWAINYFSLLTDITAQVTGAGWRTRSLAPGSGQIIRLELTPAASLAGGQRIDVRVNATSVSDPLAQDAVLAIATTALPFRPDLLIRNSGEGDALLIGGNVYNVTGQNQRKTQTIASGATATYVVAVQNDSNRPDRFRITGLAGRLGWTIRYFDAASGGAEITGGMTAAGWISPEVAPGSALQIRMEVVAGAGVAPGAVANTRIMAASVGDLLRQDVVVATTRVAMPRGNTLISDTRNHRVIEVDAAGSIVWQYGTTGSVGTGENQLSQPFRAQRLASGNTLIADLGNNRVIEVRANKTVAWQFDRSSFPASADETNLWGQPSSAERLASGNTLIAAQGDSTGLQIIPENTRYHGLIEVRPDKTVFWEVVRRLGRPAHIEVPSAVYAARLANGNTLVTHTVPSFVLELDPSQRAVWTYKKGLLSPRTAVRLPNGNVLIADTYNYRVIEVNPTQRIVWQYGETGRYGWGRDQLALPESALALANGNILIADYSRVIEVDRNKNIVWRYGLDASSGSGANQLSRATDAQRVGAQ